MLVFIWRHEIKRKDITCLVCIQLTKVGDRSLAMQLLGMLFSQNLSILTSESDQENSDLYLKDKEQSVRCHKKLVYSISNGL